MSPTRLYRLLARAEAVTWALLLTGMFLKYVTETTELGVRVFGLLHGVVFIAYCLATGLLWVDRRWSFGRFLLGLGSAVPPFATIAFEMYAERRGLLGTPYAPWRLASEGPRTVLEKLTVFVLRRPLQGALLGSLAVAGLTAVALVIGPPVG